MIPQLTGQVWAMVGLLSSVQGLLPPLVREIFSQWWESFKNYFNIYSYLEIPQSIVGGGFSSNDLYYDALRYYSNLEGAAIAPTQTAFKAKNSSILAMTADSDQLIHDSFHGVTVIWTQQSILKKMYDGEVVEKNLFRLKVNKIALDFFKAYVEHVVTKVEELRHEERDISLATNFESGEYSEKSWSGLTFSHPATFNTLALDPVQKHIILADLNRFKEAKNFYRRIGRAWKRGYLLYGPPGTGKTSLIAAIANYMRYNVYDLDLTNVKDNVELRRLLFRTKEKSIIVIEDIDCSLDLNDRASARGKQEQLNSKVSLSGLLNFTDGLWSSCGEERIFIFTTNHKEHLDPALLRCGRMDVHVNLTYSNFLVFKALVFNYLRVEDHELYPAVEEKICAGAEMTPSQIIEALHANLEDPNKALTTVISALNVKMKEKEDKRLTQSTDREE